MSEEMIKGGLVFPETYNRRLTCDNCSTPIELKIPLGITIHKYAEDHKCPHCGCALLCLSNQPYISNIPLIYLPYGGRGW